MESSDDAAPSLFDWSFVSVFDSLLEGFPWTGVEFWSEDPHPRLNEKTRPRRKIGLMRKEGIGTPYSRVEGAVV